MSNSRYLKLVEPRLATRIFMSLAAASTRRSTAPAWSPALTEKRLEQPFGRTGNHVAADQLARLLGGLGAGFDRGADAADVALHDRRDQRPADADPLDDLHVGRLG